MPSHRNGVRGCFAPSELASPPQGGTQGRQRSCREACRPHARCASLHPPPSTTPPPAAAFMHDTCLSSLHPPPSFPPRPPSRMSHAAPSCIHPPPSLVPPAHKCLPVSLLPHPVSTIPSLLHTSSPRNPKSCAQTRFETISTAAVTVPPPWRSQPSSPSTTFPQRSPTPDSNSFTIPLSSSVSNMTTCHTPTSHLADH